MKLHYAFSRVRTWLVPCLALPFFLLAPAAFAQGTGGTVTGTVIDNNTGKYLEGADVTVEGTSIHTATARSGAFELNNVPAGPQKIVVNYPGRDATTVPVDVTPGKAANVPVRLGASDIIELSEFKVAGTKEGMAQAVAIQKVAVNSKIVAAGDQYGDIAEGNAAEYLKFLPGVGIDYNANDARAVTLRGMGTQFTNVTMNGNPIASASSGNLARRFEFEQVAINNVETIEVIKTLTPELQATSTGGDVNLVTRSAFDRETDQLTYRAYIQGINDDLYFKRTEGWGQRLSRKITPGVDINYAKHLGEKLGVNISYKNSQLINDYPRSSNTWEYNPANGGSPTAPALTSWNLQNEQKLTRRQSFSTQVDYKFTDRTKLSLLGDWNYYDLLFTDRVVTVNTGALAPLATTSSPAFSGTTVNGIAGKGSVAMQTINRKKTGVTWVFPASLTHEFENGSQLDLGAYWSNSYSHYRDTAHGFFSDATMSRTGLTVSFDKVQSLNPAYRITDSTGAAVDLTDISKFSVTQIRSRPQTGEDTKDGYSADYKFDLKTAIPMSLKFGGRVDYTKRTISNPIFNKTSFSPAVTGSQLAGYADTLFSQHSIGYGLPAYNFINLYSLYSGVGGLSYIPYTPASDIQADFKDTTTAEYLRYDVTPIKDVLIIAGVRHEDRKTDTRNRLTTLPAPINTKFEDKTWYPSVNLKYTPRRSLVFRAGFSKSIGLPDYSDLLPGPLTITDPTSTARGKISLYNSGLQAYKVNNYDAGVEYYFSHSGYVSFSVFRKDLRNFIITATEALDAASATRLGIPQSALGAPYDQYDITTRFNVREPGHYQGIEMAYAQNFTFLPKPFNTLGLQINTTLLQIQPIKTNMVFSSTDAALNAAILEQVNRSLELASVKRAMNVQLNYSYGKFGFNIITNYTGKVLKVVSQKTVKYSDLAANQYYNELQYQSPRELVDIRIDYKWNRKYTPYLEVRNIFGRSISMATQSVPFNHAEYGDPIYEFGVRGVW